MKAVMRFGATGRFSWIGSDGWGARGLAYLGKEAEVSISGYVGICEVWHDRAVFVDRQRRLGRQGLGHYWQGDGGRYK